MILFSFLIPISQHIFQFWSTSVLPYFKYFGKMVAYHLYAATIHAFPCNLPVESKELYEFYKKATGFPETLNPLLQIFPSLHVSPPHHLLLQFVTTFTQRPSAIWHSATLVTSSPNVFNQTLTDGKLKWTSPPLEALEDKGSPRIPFFKSNKKFGLLSKISLVSQHFQIGKLNWRN